MKLLAYQFHPFFLEFYDRKIESVYREQITRQTLLFCRISWGMILFLDIVFAVMDRIMFADHAGAVLTARIILFICASFFLAVTFIRRLQRLMVYSSGLFILLISLLCLLLVALSDRTEFSPYFLGVFFGFAGIFTTAGMGFRNSLASLILVIIIYNITFGFFIQLEKTQFLLYNFFLPGIVLVFGYAGYLVERISRNNFIVTQQLQESLDNVRELKGLLPICASCKKIRDDQGYWNEVETYFATHSEVGFSHSICPDCVKKLYPELID